MSKNLPIVAIVGRANVGKSSLFNRLVDQPRAVVAREAGTTRDSISEHVSHDGYGFVLVDTAGLKTAEDDFEATIQEQIDDATSIADLIVVVISVETIITDEDRRVAKKALKSKKPVILAVNKIDRKSKQDLQDYQKLGIKSVVRTSAEHLRGIDELLDTITSNLPKRALKQSKTLKIALVGRPNVGKSYIFNTLATKQQAIVADKAGTTRDVNKVTVNFEKTPVELFDTAGIRRSGKIEVGIEKFSVLRSVWAIEHADVCVLVMDAGEHSTKLDQKIAGMVKDAGKGLILAMNKWDLLDKDAFTHDQMLPKIKQEFDFVPWAPLVFTSAETGQNLTKLFEMALDIYGTRQKKVPTTKLNDTLQSAVMHHPPAGLKNTTPKLRYMVQSDISPPQFIIYGRSLRLLHWSYKRYLEREMRRVFGFEGTPIKFYFRENEANDKAKRKPHKR